MKVMTPKKRVITVLTKGMPDKVPVLCVTQLGIKDTMTAMNAYFPDAHNDAEKMAKLGSALIELAELENARIPFCMTILAEAFGCEINFGTDEITPSIKKHLFPVDKLEIPGNFLERGRIPIVRDAVKILKSTIGDEYPIIVGIEGPFVLVSQIFGIEQLMRWCITDTEKIKEFTKVTTEAIIMYANHILKSGADIICIPDLACDIIDPESFKNLVKIGLKEVAKNIDGIIILHACGDTTNLLAEIAECGFNGLSIEEAVDMEKARSILGKNVILIGNISAKQTLVVGTPDKVKNETIKALNAGVDILAPGCGLPPITPLHNIVAMVQAVKEWR